MGESKYCQRLTRSYLLRILFYCLTLRQGWLWEVASPSGTSPTVTNIPRQASGRSVARRPGQGNQSRAASMLKAKRSSMMQFLMQPVLARHVLPENWLWLLSDFYI